MSDLENILELALGAGFDLAGLVPLGPPRDGERFERWLAAGRQAGMDWFERQRGRILDPGSIDPGARTLLIVGKGHGRAAGRVSHGGEHGANADGGTGEARIARYALGRDYHSVLSKRLRRLSKRLQELDLTGPGRSLVDAGPLMERSHAHQAGLGFPSKSANLLHPDHGPWFFLGELFLDRDLFGVSSEEAGTDPPGISLATAPTPPPGSCGTCTACLDACPTGALLEPGVLDAGLCISYQTIENRAAIPHALRPHLGPWVFGCDICSEVCPWGEGTPDHSREFGTHAFVEQSGAGGLAGWLQLPAAAFPEQLAGSPLRRPGRDGLVRNAVLALGNAPSEAGRAALPGALQDGSPLVRSSALWALHRGFGQERGMHRTLEQALARETDPGARADMEVTLRP